MHDDIEDALRALVPAADIDRDRVLFESGRAAGRRAVAFWRSLSLVGVAASAVLGGLLLSRPVANVPVPVYIYRPAADPAPEPPPSRPGRDEIFRWGLEGDGPPPSPGPATVEPGRPYLSSLGVLEP